MLAKAQRIDGLVTFLPPSVQGWGPGGDTGESVIENAADVPMEFSALE